jgi:hypothetical protein
MPKATHAGKSNFFTTCRNRILNAVGKVITEIEVSNEIDRQTGRATTRAAQVSDAIVDSGATMLSLSKDVISELGLQKTGERLVNTATGTITLDIFGPVRLKVMGREGIFEAMELKHPKIKALVGQLPLEAFDFLIHPGVNRLIPNPFHDNQLILDQLTTDDYINPPL